MSDARFRLFAGGLDTGLAGLRPPTGRPRGARLSIVPGLRGSLGLGFQPVCSFWEPPLTLAACSVSGICFGVCDRSDFSAWLMDFRGRPGLRFSGTPLD